MLPVQLLSSSITSKHPCQPLHRGHSKLLTISYSFDCDLDCSDAHAAAVFEEQLR